MKRLPLALLSMALVMASFSPPAKAVNLATDAKDAVLLERSPYWNLNVQKKDSTHYKLTGKTLALSSYNYGIYGVGTTDYTVSGDVTLTQGVCNTLWGSATNTNAYLYVGFSAGIGTALCVSNVSTATTKPATTTGNSGFMSCSGALPSTTPVRLIGYDALNCTGPVIGTVTELSSTQIASGTQATPVQSSHVVKFAGVHTTTGGNATEAFTVTGVLATDVVLATLQTKGGTPRTILTTAATADTITLVFSGDPSTDHVVSYVVYRSAN